MTASVFAPLFFLPPLVLSSIEAAELASACLVSDVFFSCQDGPVEPTLSYDEY